MDARTLSVPSLTFEFLADPAETVRASRYIQRRQRFGWLQRAIWPMLALLAVVHLSTGGRLEELWLLGLLALFFGSLALLGPWMQRRQYRRMYDSTPAMRAPQVYRFSADGLTIIAGPATTTLGWDAFVEADESDDAFLLFYSKQCAYYLPKRAVAREPELRELLRAHLGVRARRLRA
jgi:hypothetical protein